MWPLNYFVEYIFGGTFFFFFLVGHVLLFLYVCGFICDFFLSLFDPHLSF